MARDRARQTVQNLQKNVAAAPEAQPPAAGHRFGPSLVCCWCGISHRLHHRDPQPCTRDPAAQTPAPAPPRAR